MSAKSILVTLVIIGLVGVFAGWITFSQSGGKATITIDGTEIKREANQAVDAGKKLMDKAKDTIKQDLHSHPAAPARDSEQK